MLRLQRQQAGAEEPPRKGSSKEELEQGADQQEGRPAGEPTILKSGIRRRAGHEAGRQAGAAVGGSKDGRRRLEPSLAAEDGRGGEGLRTDEVRGAGEGKWCANVVGARGGAERLMCVGRERPEQQPREDEVVTLSWLWAAERGIAPQRRRAAVTEKGRRPLV